MGSVGEPGAADPPPLELPLEPLPGAVGAGELGVADPLPGEPGEVDDPDPDIPGEPGFSRSLS